MKQFTNAALVNYRSGTTLPSIAKLEMEPEAIASDIEKEIPGEHE